MNKLKQLKKEVVQLKDRISQLEQLPSKSCTEFIELLPSIIPQYKITD